MNNIRLYEFFAENSYKILFVLLIILLGIEYKPLEYNFSKVLLSIFGSVPSVFDRKLYFYASDLLLYGLVLHSLFVSRQKMKEVILGFSGIALLSFLFFTLISILFSEFSVYGWQFFRFLNLVNIIVFSIFLSRSNSFGYQRKIIQTIFISLVVFSVFQSVIAITQYFLQDRFLMSNLNKSIYVDHRDTSVIVGGPESFWTIDKIFSWKRAVPIFRAYGSFIHPNILGFFLFSCCFASLFFIQKTHKKWMKILLTLAFFLQSFALVLTFSRICLFSWTIFVSLWIYCLFRYFPYRRSRNHYILVTFLSTFMILTSLFYEQFFTRFVQNTKSEIVTLSTERSSRYLQLVTAVRLAIDNPVTGVGFENYMLAQEKYFPKLHQNGLPLVHNLFMVILAEIGIFGFLSLLGYVGYVLYRFFTSPITLTSMTLFVIFSGMVCLSLFDFYFIIFQIGRVYFFMFASLILYVTQKQSKEVPSLTL